MLLGEGLRRFDNDEWHGFLACFLNVIEDCPLTCNAPVAQAADPASQRFDLPSGQLPTWSNSSNTLAAEVRSSELFNSQLSHRQAFPVGRAFPSPSTISDRQTVENAAFPRKADHGPQPVRRRFRWRTARQAGSQRPAALVQYDLQPQQGFSLRAGISQPSPKQEATSGRF
jgi:hypothetical protein